MKRFYTEVTVVGAKGSFEVHLDGRSIKTPEKSACIMPTKIMAEAVAKEWREQEEEIKPDLMPITKLMNTAIDRVDKRRNDLINELVEYAGSDQLCYRADDPVELIEIQNKLWNPLLDKIKDVHNVKLKLTTGIVFIEQDKQQINKIRSLIEEIESFKLTAFYGITTVSGSVTIGFNLFEGHINIDEAWDAGQCDENFQISKWGLDYEAEDRRKNLRQELESAAYFLTLCR
ncbi:MAG: ATPase [Kordiimonadaceae bacterium]|jgi:chaperone required for assembly of F1-ATPase|nr:ATPase [Kordiimonadaceae bacterium]